MKKALLMMVIAASMSVTTGCGAKKRVKALEAELARCRQKKASISETTAPLPDQQVVALVEQPE